MHQKKHGGSGSTKPPVKSSDIPLKQTRLFLEGFREQLRPYLITEGL